MLETKLFKLIDEQIVDEKSGFMGAATERLVPMPCCDHREIARHGEQNSNYKKLLNAIIDGIQLPQSNAQSSKGAVPVI
jgi:hypothetical protein